MRDQAESPKSLPLSESTAAVASAQLVYCSSHEEVKANLDQFGFAVIDNVIAPPELNAMHKELTRLQDEESYLAGGNDFTLLQKYALTNKDRMIGRLAAILYRRMLSLTDKYVFRISPGFKTSLQNRIARPAPANGLLGRLCSEVMEICYIAAVKERGATRICNLLNKSTEFDRCLTNPHVLSAVAHILDGDRKLSSLNFRAALPGGGLQPLHVDWHEPVEPHHYFACNVLFVLDDFTPENGPTRVIPGSHLWKATPLGSDAELRKRHPQELSILARAGSVIVLNSHIWHGGTANTSNLPRRILQCYFVRQRCRPQLDQASYATPLLLRRLPESARALLVATS